MKGPQVSSLHILLVFLQSVLLVKSFSYASMRNKARLSKQRQASFHSSKLSSSPTALPMSLFGRRRANSANGQSATEGVTSTATATAPSLSSSAAAAATAATLTPQQWEVYVDQSKPSLDRGASATLDAFLGLAPSDSVKVIAGILSPASSSGGSSSSGSSSGGSKRKGPLIRCMTTNGQKCFDVANVDGVDKVYRVLTKHMQLTVNYKQCECLKWKYKGNAQLEAGKFDAALEAYNHALTIIRQIKQQQQQQPTSTISSTNNNHDVSRQEGILLLMRATAYLQRAASHKRRLKDTVKELMGMVPDASQLKGIYEQASVFPPSVRHSMFRRVLNQAADQEVCFRRTQYWHGLYQYALLQAAQDVLKSTQLLPSYSRGWARAGEILSELWKLSESAQYYEKAVQCDSSLEQQLKPVINRLKKRQELLESARAYGWSEDTLRLALDVAG